MEEKLYLVPYVTPVVLKFLEPDENVPQGDDFLKEIPPLFMLSGSLNHLDYSIMKVLKEDGKPYQALGNMLNHQNDKINMIVSFLMEEFSSKEKRYYSKGISGNEIEVFIPQNLQCTISQNLKLEIYLVEFSQAIYAYGEIEEIILAKDLENDDTNQSSYNYGDNELIDNLINKNEDTTQNNPQNIEKTEQKLIRIKFTQIREKDRESLINTTFKMQSKLLKERSLARNKV